MFISTLFIGTFRGFPLNNTSIFFSKLPVIVIYLGMWYFGWADLLPLEYGDFKKNTFTKKGAIFPILSALNSC